MKLVDKRGPKKIPYEDLVVGRVYEDSDGDILIFTGKGDLVVLVATALVRAGCVFVDAKKETFTEVSATLVLE